MDIPLMYVITCDGDMSDADYTGVSKSLTATGSQYRIAGPLAKALAGVIAEAIAAEREECAKVAKSEANKHFGIPEGVCLRIEAAIRARGK